MALSFILVTADPLEPHNSPDVAGAIGSIRLWLDGVASDRWLIVTEAWDGLMGTALKVSDISKFKTEAEKVLTRSKVLLSDYSLSKSSYFRMDLNIPGAWLNGYTG